MKFFKFLSNNDIRSASIGSVIIKFGSSLVAFINGVLLARFLSLEGLGQYVLVFSTVSILIIPSTLGIPNLLTRYISKYVVHEDYEHLKGILQKAHIYVFYTTLIIYFFAVLSYFLWWKNYESMVVETIFYGLLLVPILGFGSLRSASLRGLKLIILADLPENLLRNLFFTILLFSIHFIGFELTPKFAMLLHAVAALIAFVIGYFFLRKHLLLQLQSVTPQFKKQEWIQQTIPFTINGGIQILRGKTFTYLIALLSSVESVAIFDVAMRGASLVSFTLNALNTAIGPFISSAFERKNWSSLQLILTKTSKIIFLTSFPVALIFIFGGSSLIEWIFGQGYRNSYCPLVIICVGQLISAMIGSVGLVLNMTGRQKVFSSNNLWMFLISLSLGLPFIYWYGEIGAAFTLSLVLVIQNLLLYRYIKNKLHLNTSVFG